jgi:hypothetical protein
VTAVEFLSGGWTKDSRGTVERYVNPNAHCPVCGAAVYFYRSPYNGRVFFDDLGRGQSIHAPTTPVNHVGQRETPSRRAYSALIRLGGSRAGIRSYRRRFMLAEVAHWLPAIFTTNFWSSVFLRMKPSILEVLFSFASKQGSMTFLKSLFSDPTILARGLKRRLPTARG